MYVARGRARPILADLRCLTFYSILTITVLRRTMYLYLDHTCMHVAEMVSFRYR